MSEVDLQALPNIGPAVAKMLVRVGIAHPDDLSGQSPERLYQRVCATDGYRHDLCLLDTFVAVVDYANGAPPRPWWYYSRLRKKAVATPTR
jgi:hypothetical protein